MREKRRVTKRPHVTLTHQKSADSEKELAVGLVALRCLEDPPSFKFKLGKSCGTSVALPEAESCSL
jgi:tRNA ligase